MISWQSIAIAALSVTGIAGCGIGAISIAGGITSRDPDERRKAELGGVQVGAVGLALLSLAWLVRFS